MGALGAATVASTTTEVVVVVDMMVVVAEVAGTTTNTGAGAGAGATTTINKASTTTINKAPATIDFSSPHRPHLILKEMILLPTYIFGMSWNALTTSTPKRSPNGESRYGS